MIFIILLGLSAAALAGSAAYFSVYGLAVTFSGVFWGVVLMGGAVEAGKLMAASYLYRFWDQTARMMRAYMIAGILVVMATTSVGIFGYLSAGYQAGILPMRMTAEQLSNVEQERATIAARKIEVDALLVEANKTTDVVVNNANGRIDARAASTLKQIEESRLAKVASITPERDYLNERIKELDSSILSLKQQSLQHEANIGPIMYIASVFSIEPEQAAKYLIFLIIFAFDPMAIALTLAVNIALRERTRNKVALKEKKAVDQNINEPVSKSEPTLAKQPADDLVIDGVPIPDEHIHIHVGEQIDVTTPHDIVVVSNDLVADDAVAIQADQELIKVLTSIPTDPVIEDELVSTSHVPPAPEVEMPPTESRYVRDDAVFTQPIPGTVQRKFTSTLSNADDPELLVEKLEWYHQMSDRITYGHTLSKDDMTEMEIIRQLLAPKYTALLQDRNAYIKFKRQFDDMMSRPPG